MKRAPNRGARGRKLRRDTRPSLLEKAVADVRRAFRMAPPPKALLIASRALIARAQALFLSHPPAVDAITPSVHGAAPTVDALSEASEEVVGKSLQP